MMVLTLMVMMMLLIGNEDGEEISGERVLSMYVGQDMVYW